MVTTGNLMLQHKNVIFLLYFCRDLSFIILTFFSTFYFSHPAFLVATFGLMLRPKHKHSNSQQFQFIQFHQNNYNLIHLHHAKIQQLPLCITFKIYAPKQDKNSPKLSIMLYQRQILKSNQEEEDTAPFWSLMLIEV